MNFPEKRARAMDRFRIAAVTVTAVFAGSSLTPFEVMAQKPSPSIARCQSVWVTAPVFPGKPASRSRKSLNFSATEVLDLEFQVVVPADASGALELKLFTPKGHLYQTLAVPAEGSAPEPATPRRRPRYRTLTARLPVAGTTIVNNSLYGTWKAEAFFQGERTACGKARTFVIKP
jgi:hypothetical protein